MLGSTCSGVYLIGACTCMRKLQHILWDGTMHACRHSVAFQSCSPALHDCCGTAIRCCSSSCQHGMPSTQASVCIPAQMTCLGYVSCCDALVSELLTHSSPCSCRGVQCLHCRPLHCICNVVTVFYGVLTWCRMVHGLLQDKHQEFFIQPASSQVTPPQAPPSPPHHPKQQPRPSQDTNAAEWHQGFQVSMQALPPGVTVAIAESILFVGKAVRVLQRPTGPLKNHDLLPQSDAISFAKALRQLQQEDVFDQIGFERKVELIRTTVRPLPQHAASPLHLSAIVGVGVVVSVVVVVSPEFVDHTARKLVVHPCSAHMPGWMQGQKLPRRKTELASSKICSIGCGRRAMLRARVLSMCDSLLSASLLISKLC